MRRYEAGARGEAESCVSLGWGGGGAESCVRFWGGGGDFLLQVFEGVCARRVRIFVGLGNNKERSCNQGGMFCV